MSDEQGALGNACAVLVFAAAAFMLVQADGDPDLWGRIAFARDAAAQGRLVLHSDVYSYTAFGQPWIDHEWGFSWFAWLTWRLGGWALLRLGRLVTLAALGTFCVLPARRAQSTAFPIAAMLLVLPLSLGSVGPRPQVFTYLFLAWMLTCLKRSEAQGPRWIVLAAAPLPLWVNLHAGFLVGLGVLGLWGAGRAVAALRHGERGVLTALTAATVLGSASVFATPWGAGYPLFALRSALLQRPYVLEWHPVGLDIYGLCLASLVGLCLPLLWTRPRGWKELAILAVLASEAALHRRHLTLFAIAAAILALPRCLEAWNEWRNLDPEGPRPPRALSWGLGLAATILSCAALARCLAAAPAEPLFPRTAMEILQARGADNVLVDFNWAQYVLFHAAPRLKVAIDGRYEEIYPPEVMAQYFAWHFGTEGWRALTDAPQTHYALVARGSDRAQRLGQLPGWTAIYSDELAVAFAKTPPP